VNGPKHVVNSMI